MCQKDNIECFHPRGRQSHEANHRRHRRSDLHRRRAHARELRPPRPPIRGNTRPPSTCTCRPLAQDIVPRQRFRRCGPRCRQDPRSPQDDIHGLARGEQRYVGCVHRCLLFQPSAIRSPIRATSRSEASICPAARMPTCTMDLKATVWSIAGEYRLMTSPEATLDLLGGARLLDLKESMEYEVTGNVGTIPLPGRAGQQLFELDELGRDHRRERPCAAGRREEVVLALLRGCRRRRVKVHLASDDGGRLPLRLGRCGRGVGDTSTTR